MSQQHNVQLEEVEFVEVVEKKKKGGGICKAILRFLGSNVGLFLVLREFKVKTNLSQEPRLHL